MAVKASPAQLALLRRLSVSESSEISRKDLKTAIACARLGLAELVDVTLNRRSLVHTAEYRITDAGRALVASTWGKKVASD